MPAGFWRNDNLLNRDDLIIDQDRKDANKMEESKYDYVVVGAGINGCWTAYHLCKRGFKTLLVDQVNWYFITFQTNLSLFTSTPIYSPSNTATECFLPISSFFIVFLSYPFYCSTPFSFTQYSFHVPLTVLLLIFFPRLILALYCLAPSVTFTFQKAVWG